RPLASLAAGDGERPSGVAPWRVVGLAAPLAPAVEWLARLAEREARPDGDRERPETPSRARGVVDATDRGAPSSIRQVGGPTRPDRDAPALGGDLRYWATVARWTVDLVANGRIVPTVDRRADG